MILYSLLYSYPNSDITNIMLTSAILYVFVYYLLPHEYNYMITAGISLVDMYFSRDMLKGNRPQPKKPNGPAPILKKQGHKKHHRKRVKFAPNPIYHRYTPQQQIGAGYSSGRPGFDMHSPQYRLQMQQMQQMMQPQMGGGTNWSQQGSGWGGYQQQQNQHQPPNFIDNRHLVDTASESSSSLSSVSVSDTSSEITFSSEEY